MNDAAQRTDKSPQEAGGHSTWQKVSDKLWDLAPWAIPALFGSVITVGISIRDNTHAIADLVSSQDSSEARLRDLERDGFDAAKRADCETVRALVAALSARLAVAEASIVSHQDAAKEWKDRIVAVEAAIRASSRDPTARPDPFTGTMGARLEERIRSLEAFKAAIEERIAYLARQLEGKRG